MKDNFSSHSEKYAKFRPTYPSEIFDYIYTLLHTTENAWDCGTGNGQVASKICNNFDYIFATDISQSQLDNAIQQQNIRYSLQAAESTDFANDFFDLIIVAQAIHWFDFDKFYVEVNRTLRKEGLLVVLGYGKLEVSVEIDAIINKFYLEVIGPFWDKERKYIDENYQTIPFPFIEIKTPTFVNTFEWTFDHLIGYLETWSAVKHFTSQEGYSPIELIFNDLKKAWGQIGLPKTVNFPILLRIGKKPLLSKKVAAI